MKAYNGFYSIKVKDPAWRSAQGLLFNVDNYVMMCLEMYYTAEFGIETWEGSPDPREKKNPPPPPDVDPDAPEKGDVHGDE